MRLFRFILFPFLIFYYSFAYSDEVNIVNDLIGVNLYYVTTKDDTLISIARKYKLKLLNSGLLYRYAAFLVLKNTQLAKPRSKVCSDCA